MAEKGQFIQELYDGFELVYKWEFPLNKAAGTVTANWEIYIKVPYQAEVLISLPSVSMIISKNNQTERWDLNFTTSFYNEGVFGMGASGRAQAVQLQPGTYFVARSGEGTSGTTSALVKNYKRLEICGFYDEIPQPVKCQVSTMTINGQTYYGTEFWGSADFQGIFDTNLEITYPERNSTISCSTTYIGENAVIIIDRFDPSFTDTITYKFGNLTGTVIEKTNTTRVYWLVPGSFLDEMGATETAGVCILTCTTYDKNNNPVGEPYNLQFNVLMDSNIGGPLFNPVVTDINDVTKALTGNNTILVKYFSTASALSEAVAQAGATITNQTISNSGKTVTGEHASFDNVESPIFDFTATDSRGFTTKTQYRATFIEYSKLTCNVKVTTPTVNGEATLTIEGNYFNGSFGQKSNTLTLKYRYGKESDGFGIWRTATATISNYNYKIEIDITGLDYKTMYMFEATAQDALMSITSPIQYVIGSPIFDWGKDNFKFNVPVSIRPNGGEGEAHEVRITTSGNIELAGDIIINGKSLVQILTNAGLLT